MLVVGGVFGDVSENKENREIAVKCMKECIDVGHAAGAASAMSYINDRIVKW